MTTTETCYNNDIVQRFARLSGKERLAHAYLFVGPYDIGKGETAVAVAKLVNCEDPQANMFCDRCPSCIKIKSGNHPDIVLIDKGYSESIKIEDIRGILDQNRLRPYLARKKVFILRNIENLTPEAANAFLKTLEEPSPDSLLLLTTSVPEKNLDTIRSRCHAIYISSASSGQLTDLLCKEYDIDRNGAHFLAYFAEGCLGTARKLMARKFFEQKNELIDDFILRRPDDASVKSLLADKMRTREWLDVCLSWMRDVFVIKAGVADHRIIHADRQQDLAVFQKRFSFQELAALNQSVVKMRQMFMDNLNIKIPLLIIGEQLWEN